MFSDFSVLKWTEQLLLVVWTGNCLGEDGCEALKEAMESMGMGDVLGSLRYFDVLAHAGKKRKTSAFN